MKTQIRLILWTVVISVLIWTYADRADYALTDVIVPVKLTPADPNPRLVLRVEDGDGPASNETRVELELGGPKRAIQLLESELSLRSFKLDVTIPGRLTPGTHESRDLRTLLSNSPQLLQRGLTLKSVKPEVIDFEVDQYEEMTVELRPDAGAYAELLDADPVVRPEQVRVRVLQSKLPDDYVLGPIPLILEDDIAEELGRGTSQAEGRLTFMVNVRSPWPEIRAEFEPKQVQVTVSLGRQSEVRQMAVRPLGVNIKTLEFLEGNYEIVWQDESDLVAQTITVSVPISKLDRFEQLDPTDIDAYVVIDRSDLPVEGGPPATGETPGGETFRSKPVHVRFPRGFEDVKLVGREPTVEFRVHKATLSPAVAE